MTHPVGTLVEHPGCPEWGPGRVLAVQGSVVTVYFRDAVEARAGDSLKRVDSTRVSLLRAAGQVDGWLSGVWLTPDGRAAWTQPRLSVPEALDAFLQRFPGGFRDPAYLGSAGAGGHGPRAEAAAGHQAWARTLGHGEDRRLVKLRSVDLFRARLLAVEEPLGLLGPSEKAALREGLREPRPAGRLFETLAEVLGAPRPEAATWEPYVEAAGALPGVGRTGPAAWPLLTLWPFLAQPDRHLFLRPGVTRECAQVLAFDLGDGSTLGWPSYERLLTLGRLLLERLAPHGAQDLIDVHAFLELSRRRSGPGARRSGR